MSTARLVTMARFIAVVVLGILLAGSGCKRCFNCTQHCVRITAKSDTNLVYKFCSHKVTANHSVDSIALTYPDSLYNKVILQDDRNVCDAKNSADEAATFFQKQDYFCVDAE